MSVLMPCNPLTTHHSFHDIVTLGLCLILTFQCLWLGDSVALSGSWDCTLRVWDIQAGICKHVLLGHTEGKLSRLAKRIGDTGFNTQHMT